MLTRRALLAALAVVLGVGVGCSGSTDFTITKSFDLNSTAGVPYGPYIQNVDLAAEAGGAWKHRSKIKSLDLVGLDATMTQRTDGGGPTTGSGSIVLSRNGVDATVGTWTDHPIPALAPDSIGVVLDAAAMSIVNDAIHGDGLFSVKLTGTTAAAVTAKVQVDLHMKMKYRVP